MIDRFHLPKMLMKAGASSTCDRIFYAFIGGCAVSMDMPTEYMVYPMFGHQFHKGGGPLFRHGMIGPFLYFIGRLVEKNKFILGFNVQPLVSHLQLLFPGDSTLYP